MNIKTRDQATRDAIQKFLEDGGRVTIKPLDGDTVRRINWQGGKVTTGFRFKQLTDRG
jgi:hypothetical protein